MAQQLRFILDGADRGQPLNPDDFGFTINEDSDLNFRVVSFNNDLTIWRRNDTTIFSPSWLITAVVNWYKYPCNTNAILLGSL